VRASSAFVLLFWAAAAQAAPQRIVSMNPCADAILAEVAVPGQIAALSHWSHDSRATSMDLETARRFPRHFGTAEEVLAFRPDLVIAGAHTPAPTRAAFQRLGIPVVLVGVPASVQESRAEIRRIAAATGRPAAGEALVERIDAALAGARHKGPRTAALLRTPAGVVPGAGTLVADVMERTGFSNAARTLGLRSWDVLPLEALLLNPPAVLLVDPGASLHPALAHARTDIRIEPLPSSYLNCGGPTIIALAGALASIRGRLP
jgi:iron complex transport system substrate-binding protein